MVAAGCSWTHGQFTESPSSGPSKVFADRYNRSWPIRYGSLVGYDRVINIGDPGSSNDKAIDNIVQLVLKLRKSTQEPIDVFLMLTDYRRKYFTFEYNSLSYMYYFIPSSSGHAGGIRKTYSIDESQDYLEFYDFEINKKLRNYVIDITKDFSILCSCTSESELVSQINRSIALLNSFCTLNNCKLHILSAFDNFTVDGVLCIGTSFHQFINHSGNNIGIYEHPSVAHHIEFAEFMFEKLRN